MFLLTTHRRADRLEKFLKAREALGINQPLTILVNGLQPLDVLEHYLNLQANHTNDKTRFIFDNIASHRTHGEATQYLFRLLEEPRDETFSMDDVPKWYGVIADDAIPRTKDWDTKLVEAAMTHGMASCNDLYKAPHRLGCAHVIRADILRALGWIVPPGFKHMYIDDVWEHIGRDLGIWEVLMDVTVEHEHYLNNKAKMDDTYKGSSQHMHADAMACQQWLAQRNKDYEKIEKVVGATSIDVDFNNLTLAVCIPSHTASFKLGCVHGIMQLQEACKVHNINMLLFTAEGNASVCDARNRLVRMFLDAKHATHMLFIDDDIGFTADSVLRLLAYNKDVIAGAAPKRGWPLTFCTHFTQEQLDKAEQGAVPVNNVGTGFMLIKREAMLQWIARNCGATMETDPTPDGSGWYTDPNKAEAFPNVFIERIKKHRRTSEDYTFCEMAREAGLSVWIDPTIRLKHFGAWHWEAAVIDGIKASATTKAA